MRALAVLLAGAVALAATTTRFAGVCEIERRRAPARREGGLNKELIDAAKAGDTTRIEKILEDGAYVDVRGSDVDAKGYDGTPLLMAVSQGHAGAVELLLANGADQTLASGDGETALHVAAKAGRDVIIRILLAYGGDVNIETKGGQAHLRGRTPLHLAIVEHPGTVNLLLDCGADLNARDAFGDTPLHHAARKVASDMVLLLLERGANPTVRNKADRLPLQEVGEDCISKEAARALIANGFTLKPDLNVALFAAVKYPPTLACVPFVEALLDQGADVNYHPSSKEPRSNRGRTPLWHAVMYNDVPMIAVLLARGADPYIKDDEGRNCFNFYMSAEIKVMLESVPRPE